MHKRTRTQILRSLTTARQTISYLRFVCFCAWLPILLLLAVSAQAQSYDIPIQPNQSVDSYPAINNTLSSAMSYVASTDSTREATVSFPSGGRYTTSHPIWIKSSLINLRGKTANILANYGEGAILVIAPPMAGIPLQNGRWLTDGSWLNLRESKAWDLDGLSEFSIEFDLKASDVPDSGAYILTSNGRELWNDPLSSALQIYTAYTYAEGGGRNALNAKVNIGGTVYWLQSHSDVIMPNVDYRVELNYSNGLVRLFVNGDLIASQAATGTLHQELFEDVILGGAFGQFPESGMYGEGVRGTIDNLRLSTVARHTASYAPQPISFDEQARFMLRFDDSDGIFTYAYTQTGGAWLTLRRSLNPSIGNVSVSDLNFGSAAGMSPNGIVVMSAYRTTIERCRFDYTREAVRLSSNSFLSTLRDLQILGTRAGIYNYAASGVGLFQNISYGGTGYGIVGQGYKLDHAFIYGTRYGVLASTDLSASSSVQLNNVVVSDEGSDGSQKGSIALANLRQFTETGGTLEAATYPRPLVTISGGISYAFYSTVFNVHPNQAGVFEFKQNPTYRASLFAPTNCRVGYPPTGCNEEGAWTLPSFAAQVSVIR